MKPNCIYKRICTGTFWLKLDYTILNVLNSNALRNYTGKYENILFAAMKHDILIQAHAMLMKVLKSEYVSTDETQ